MKLTHYIQTNKLSYEEFGKLIGASGTSVYRYCSGLRIPNVTTMAAIVAATRGKVTANDFYDVSHVPQPKAKRRTIHEKSGERFA